MEGGLNAPESSRRFRKRGDGSASSVEGRRAQQQKIIPHSIICALKNWLWRNFAARLCVPQ